MSISEIKDFIFENYYKRIGFSKQSSYYSVKRLNENIYCCANKLIRNISDPRNAKEHYKSFMLKENR